MAAIADMDLSAWAASADIQNAGPRPRREIGEMAPDALPVANAAATIAGGYHDMKF